MKLQLRHKVAIVVTAAAALVILLVATKAHVPQNVVTAGFGAEFMIRPDGYPGLAAHYGFEFATEPLNMDPGLMYKACADGLVDVICGYGTDGRIPAYDLKIIEDDKFFFPPYYAAPVVRADLLTRFPEVGEVLGRLGGVLDDEKMQLLNFEVDENGRKPRDVAVGWLKEAGLIDAPAAVGSGSKGPIVIGGKPFSEQDILVYMMSTMIETHTDVSVVTKPSLGGSMICFAALKTGDLDVTADYTGTGLVNVLKMDVITDPDQAYQVVKDAYQKNWDLIWLEPFGFNNAYTITMRAEHAKRLGVHNISDLARVVNQQKIKLGL